MKQNKIMIYLLTILFILISVLFLTTNMSKATSDTTKIALSEEGITVEGETISEDSSQAVYLTKVIETHSDLSTEQQNITNSVINITKAGNYEITGTMKNAQIAINADSSEEVTLTLSGVNITCQTAPAIIVYQAAEPQTAGEAGMHFYLTPGTTNTITGSHIPKDSSHSVNGQEIAYTAKYDAAISSDISVDFDGTGKLIVDSDNEGIETKMHFTIHDGDYSIISCDDGINASEDQSSIITIDGGSIYINIKEEAQEGDGIDSNGSIYINGGTVYTFASEMSQDSGLDSDDGIYINGGTVIGTGNMADEISNDSKQTFLQVQFSEKQKAGKLLTVLNSEENPIVAFQTEKEFSVLEISTPTMTEGEYTIYEEGTIEGENLHGLYTTITSYVTGTEVMTTSTGSNGRMQEPGELPDMSEEQEKQNTNNQILGILLLGIAILIVVLLIIYFRKNSKETVLTKKEEK